MEKISAILLVIVALTWVRTSAQQTVLNEQSSVCDLDGKVLTCDLENKYEGATLSMVNEDFVNRVFIFNAQSLGINDSNCVNVSVTNSKRVFVARDNITECEWNVELSVKNSMIDFIPAQVTSLYFEDTVLSSLVTTNALEKLIVINTSIDELDIMKPFFPGVRAIFQSSVVKVVKRLPVHEKSSLIFKNSKIFCINNHGLSVKNAEIFFRDSNISTTSKDSFSLEENSALVLENFSGNLSVKTKFHSFDYNCPGTYFNEYLTCVILLVLSIVLQLIFLTLYIRLRLAVKEKYTLICQTDGGKENVSVGEEIPVEKGEKGWSFFGNIIKLLGRPGTSFQIESFDPVYKGDAKQLENLWQKYTSLESESKKLLHNLKSKHSNKTDKIDRDLKRKLDALEKKKAKDIACVLVDKDANNFSSQMEKFRQEKVEASHMIKVYDEETVAYYKKFYLSISTTKDIIQNGLPFLSILHESLKGIRSTCNKYKDTLKEIKQYEDHYSTFETGLSNMISVVAELPNKTPTENENNSDKIRDLLNALQERSDLFNDDVDRIEKERVTELHKLCGECCEGKDVGALSNLQKLEMDILTANYILDIRKRIQNYTKTYLEFIKTEVEKFNFQLLLTDNLGCITSTILSFWKLLLLSTLNNHSQPV